MLTSGLACNNTSWTRRSIANTKLTSPRFLVKQTSSGYLWRTHLPLPHSAVSKSQNGGRSFSFSLSSHRRCGGTVFSRGCYTRAWTQCWGGTPIQNDEICTGTSVLWALPPTEPNNFRCSARLT